MEPTFPTLDRWSMPLILLLVQGFIFVVLIGYRYYKDKNQADLLLAILLFLYCFERLHYAIGFMSWYDTFPTTKINYLLYPMTLALGPLLYFYVRAVTSKVFKITKKQLYHFIPFLAYSAYRLGLFIYDSSQVGFNATQNGILMSGLEINIIFPLFILLSSFHLLLYIAFTIQLYYHYRLQIKEFYSDAYKYEMNWIRNFLVLFSLLFLYDVLQNIVDGFIVDLHWQQKWWLHALSCAAIIYFGIKGYFTKVRRLQELNFSFGDPKAQLVQERTLQQHEEEKIILLDFMLEKRPHLNPTLTLKDLAIAMNFSTGELSSIINEGMGVNFNDFINDYRVKEVKRLLDEQKHKELSLVGIAYDSGFNSKATFNRVFKKLSGISPSEYIKNQEK